MGCDISRDVWSELVVKAMEAILKMRKNIFEIKVNKEIKNEKIELCQSKLFLHVSFFCLNDSASRQS